MGERLRMGFGVLGETTSLLLYAVPMSTFARVMRKRSTEDFSCIPYVIALLNCFLYTWYGLPVVSAGMENLPLITVNGLGLILEASFIIIYFWFASAKTKMKVAIVVVPVLLICSITAVISSSLLHDHHRRKIFVGSIGFVTSAAMYGSPLVAVKQVIQTKSLKFMPFYLSLFSFLASGAWLTYGLLSHDLFLAAPNIIGCPLGFLQLVFYFVYKRKEKQEETNKCDAQSKENTKQLQSVFGKSNNDKV